MNPPKWVSRDDVEALHDLAIEMGGGLHGLRDASLLESALGRPQNQYAYGAADIFQLAAGYAEAISRNQPFVEGNKRTAFMTADLFLSDNGQSLGKGQGARHAEMIEQLSQGQISRKEMGAYFAAHSRSIGQEDDREPAQKPLSPEMEAIKREAQEHLQREGHGQDQGEDI